MMQRTLGDTRLINGRMGRFEDQRSETIGGRLYRMIVHFIDESCLMVCFVGEDRTGLINHISDQISHLGLNIDESFGMRMQGKHGSFFLVSGVPFKLRELVKRLKQRRHETVNGEFVQPDKVFDMVVRGPDRPGLIFDISSVLMEFGYNILGLRTYTGPMPEGKGTSDLGHGDRPCDPWNGGLMGYIHVRFESNNEGLGRLPRLEDRTHEVLHQNHEHQVPIWTCDIEECRENDPRDLGPPNFLGQN
jgi:predicted amino acid-binding ACT domain protein